MSNHQSTFRKRFLLSTSKRRSVILCFLGFNNFILFIKYKPKKAISCAARRFMIAQYRFICGENDEALQDDYLLK